MSILSTLFYSFRKSRKLAKLQRIISPPNRTAEDLMANILNHQKEDKALEEYFNLCMSDTGVAYIVEQWGLSRKDLREIYLDLDRNGGGQYIKGHYVSLSTIAYMEPLKFYLEAKEQGLVGVKLISILLDYWLGKIKIGQLNIDSFKK